MVGYINTYIYIYIYVFIAIPFAVTALASLSFGVLGSSENDKMRLQYNGGSTESSDLLLTSDATSWILRGISHTTSCPS